MIRMGGRLFTISPTFLEFVKIVWDSRAKVVMNDEHQGALPSAEAANRAPSDDSLGRIAPQLEKYRQYLLAIAMAELPPDLAGKIGASDVVQDTLYKGCQSLTQFEGEVDEQLAAWLRQILLNQLTNQIRAYRSEKRNVARERIVEGLTPPGREPSPSTQLASREEQERFQSALARLPTELRLVIHLRHEEDLTFAQIAQRIGRSEETARRRWAHAVQQLQVELKQHERRSN